MILVANFHRESCGELAIGFPAEGPWRVRFQSDWSGYSEHFEDGACGDVTAGPGECDGLPFRGAIAIPPLHTRR